MRHEVLRDEFQPVLRSDDRLEGSPLRLELLLDLYILVFGYLLELTVDEVLQLPWHLQLGESALIEDRDCRSILYCAFDVVNRDVLAEHGASVAIAELDRRSREADEGGVRQRVAKVSGEPLAEAVLAAM